MFISKCLPEDDSQPPLSKMKLPESVLQNIQNNAIAELNLASLSLRKKDIQFLCKALRTNQSVKTLILDDKHILDESYLKFMSIIDISDMLKVNTTLTELSLSSFSSNSYSNALNTKNAISLAQGLADNKTLKILNLKHNNIEAPGVVALAKALMNNPSLHTLQLDDNPIGLEGAKALGELLKHSQSLTVFTVGSSSIIYWRDSDGDKRPIVPFRKTNGYLIPEAGLDAIIEGLARNGSLQRLGIGADALSTTNITSLAKIIESKPHLAELALMLYRETWELDSDYFSRSLESNTSLKALSILLASKVPNHKTGPNIAALAQALEKNTGLVSLSITVLGGNTLDTRLLARSLKKNTSLAYLDVSYNKIDDEGARALAEMLAVNRSLVDLNLEHNEIVEGAVSLIQSLAKNPTLCYLNFDNNQRRIDSEFKKSLHYVNAEGRALFEQQLEANRAAGRELLEAASTGEVTRLVVSLSLGASVHYKDTQGDTPLHYAVNHNQLKIVRILLELGASPHLRNSNNLSPLEIAEQNNKQTLVQQLISPITRKSLAEITKDFSVTRPETSLPQQTAATPASSKQAPTTSSSEKIIKSQAAAMEAMQQQMLAMQQMMAQMMAQQQAQASTSPKLAGQSSQGTPYAFFTAPPQPLASEASADEKLNNFSKSLS